MILVREDFKGSTRSKCIYLKFVYMRDDKSILYMTLRRSLTKGINFSTVKNNLCVYVRMVDICGYNVPMLRNIPCAWSSY